MFFATRARLSTTTAVATLVALALGAAIVAYIRATSDDVGIDFLLIVVWITAIMGSAALQACLTGDLLWGDRWRRKTLLGWQPSMDELEPEDVKERGWMLTALFIILLVGNYAGHVASTDNFFAWYQFRGFALVQLRSPDPTQRLEAVIELSAHDDEVILQALEHMVEDPEPTVRAEALGVMGDRRRVDARDSLFRALEGSDDNVRAAAAEALGKVRGEGVLQALAGLLSRGGSPELRRGALAGLGLLKDERASPLIAGWVVHPDASPEVRAVAVWALGELRPPNAEALLLDTLQADSDDVGRCAALHALGKLLDGNAHDVPGRLKTAFAAGHGKEGFGCPRTFVTVRAQERCFVKLNRPSEVPYEGECIQLQVCSPEKLRVKMVRSAARAAGKKSLQWLADIGNDVEEHMSVRVWATELFKKLKAR